MCMSDEEPGETVVMCRLVLVFAGRHRDKYQSSWTGAVFHENITFYENVHSFHNFFFFINFHDFFLLISMIFLNFHGN